MQAYLDKITTCGMGYWSDVIKEVKTVGYTVDASSIYFGELRVYFDTKTWNVDEDGLIYTDDAFLESIRVAFGTNDIEYSEQGMQGDDFVSFDVGSEFLNMYEGA
jgi:hypothetical protein